MEKKTKDKIRQAIEAIPKGDILSLQGKDKEFILRVGKYRVIFQYLDEEQKVLCIMDIGSRGDIYK